MFHAVPTSNETLEFLISEFLNPRGGDSPRCDTVYALRPVRDLLSDTLGNPGQTVLSPLLFVAAALEIYPKPTLAVDDRTRNGLSHSRQRDDVVNDERWPREKSG